MELTDRTRYFSGWKVLVLSILPLSAEGLHENARRISDFTLPNGLHCIVMERHEAPVIAGYTYLRTGSVDDPAGQTGMAHMLEHLASRGSESIGTRDWAGEKKAMEAVEEAYDRWDVERNKGPQADVGKTGAAQVLLNRAIEQARVWSRPGEVPRIFEENGAVGWSVKATADGIVSAANLPSNRLELWFLMESQRLLRPAFRDFYTEREAIAAEYRDRVEKHSLGAVSQALFATALASHPYRQPLLGWPGDVANLRMKQVKDFLDRNCVPGNLTVVVVGDVVPAEAKRLAERYFGSMPSRSIPSVVHTSEPPQTGPKTVVVEAPGAPAMMAGYHRPNLLDPDSATLDLIQSILGAGTSGWIHKELMQEKKTAAIAQVNANSPGGRYPSLFTVLLVATPGHTVEENQKGLEEILNRLIAQRPDGNTLARAKAQARAGMLARLESNGGWASHLAAYQSLYGDWKKVFQNIEDFERVNTADVQRVARKLFKPSNRTLAYTVAPTVTQVAR